MISHSPVTGGKTPAQLGISRDRADELALASAALGRSVGACSFAGPECAYQSLAMLKCGACATSYHELCTISDVNLSNKGYQDGCPSCFAKTKV